MIDLSSELLEESSEISLDGTVFLFARAEATGHVLCMLGTMRKSLAVPQICVFPSLPAPELQEKGRSTDDKIAHHNVSKRKDYDSDK